MGQEHHKTALSDPFALSGWYELVDDALGGVVEVSELRLPAHQGIGVGHGESQLKAKHSILGQRRVAHSVRGLVWVQVSKYVVLGLVNLREEWGMNATKASTDIGT